MDETRARLPEMPTERAARYEKDMGLSETDAAVLTDSIDVARYFEDTVKSGANPKRAGDWVRTEVLRFVNERQISVDDLTVKPASLAELLTRVESGKLSTTQAKGVFEEMLPGLSIDAAIKKTGAVEGGVGADALLTLVKSILAANPDIVEEIKSGKDTKGKKVKFLQGLIMREAKGQAKPDEATVAIEAALKGE